MSIVQKNWQELIKPSKLEILPGSDPSRFARIVAEPLERGFGVTLGNALRRVLLSSLQGAACTAIQIDGVLHEFSSIPGVREDVTDIVLNVKSLALRMHGDGPKRMYLEGTGPGEITAGMIVAGHDIEIVEPDIAICTLDDGAKLSMELTVDSGKGYVPAVQNRAGRRADRAGAGGRRVQPGAQGRLPGGEHPGRPDHRLRQAVARHRDQRGDHPGGMRWRSPRASCRTSSSSSSISRSPRSGPRRRCPPSRRSTRTCSGRWTSWNSRCVPPTASRTTTSSISATWSRRASRRCCGPPISGASR